MTNCKMTVKGDILTIEVNLKENHGASGSGKSIIVGTTSGSVVVEGTDTIANVNVYRKAEK